MTHSVLMCVVVMRDQTLNPEPHLCLCAKYAGEARRQLA